MNNIFVAPRLAKSCKKEKKKKTGPERFNLHFCPNSFLFQTRHSIYFIAKKNKTKMAKVVKYKLLLFNYFENHGETFFVCFGNSAGTLRVKESLMEQVLSAE